MQCLINSCFTKFFWGEIQCSPVSWYISHRGLCIVMRIVSWLCWWYTALVHRGVCVCVCMREWVGVLILHSRCFRVSPLHCCAIFYASWGICRLYTQKYFQFFCHFPFISYGRSSFLRALSFFESCPQFFCVFTYQVP